MWVIPKIAASVVAFLCFSIETEGVLAIDCKIKHLIVRLVVFGEYGEVSSDSAGD
jgi:hypothetical protein